MWLKIQWGEGVLENYLFCASILLSDSSFLFRAKVKIALSLKKSPFSSWVFDIACQTFSINESMVNLFGSCVH